MIAANDNARLMSRQAAAAYCGVSVSTFASWVKSGHMPAPLFGSKRWDKRAIDATLDKASDLDNGSPVKVETEYQKRKRERARAT